MSQTWRILVLGIGFQYVHTISTRISYYLHVPREPLYDLGFEYLFTASPVIRLLSEVCSKVLGIWTLVILLRPLFRSKQSPTPFTMSEMMVQAVSVLLCVEMLRILTFASTTLPGPSSVCRPGSPSYSPPTSASLSQLVFPLDLFPTSTWLATQPTCGDNVFSWHIALLLLCTMIIQQFGFLRRNPKTQHPGPVVKARIEPGIESNSVDDDEDNSSSSSEEDVSQALKMLRSPQGDSDTRCSISAAEELDLCSATGAIIKSSFRKSLRALPWILTLIPSLVAISLHINYSLDIVVAWFTVPLTWKAFDRTVGITARQLRAQELEDDEDLDDTGTDAMQDVDEFVSKSGMVSDDFVDEDVEYDGTHRASSLVIVTEDGNQYDDV